MEINKNNKKCISEEFKENEEIYEKKRNSKTFYIY